MKFNFVGVKIAAEETRQQAVEQERQAIKLKKVNQAIKRDAEADLSRYNPSLSRKNNFARLLFYQINRICLPCITGKVKPMLAAAEASLRALNKGDITEVKAMKRPPVGVVLVIEAMCIVKNVKPLKVLIQYTGFMI